VGRAQSNAASGSDRLTRAASGSDRPARAASGSDRPARARRHLTVGLVSLGLGLLLGAMAIAIMLAQGESRARIRSTFHLRATSSAKFVSTFLSQGAGVRGSTLGSFVQHAIPYREHGVYLVDGYGRLLAASPSTTASTLAGADPLLAKAVADAPQGPVPGARVPSTFTVAPVESTSWKLIIAVPDTRLYSSIEGWAQRVPWIVFALVSTFGALLVAMFWRSLADRARLATLSRELSEAAHTDPVTGLANRRALNERLVRAMIHARRRDQPFSVLMIDLDCFKQINDTLGHDAGDRVLARVADCLESVFRADDIYGRWGGDEFLVALLSTDEEGAWVAAERLLVATRAAPLRELGLEQGVPLSIGVASGTYTTPEHLIARADAALYRSKAEGRGRITIDWEHESSVAAVDSPQPAARS
jgi:diguanylate cyclase (GGDEF)-like protein